MTPERTVVLGEIAGGAAILLTGLSALGHGVGWLDALAGAGAAVGVAALAFVADRGAFDGAVGEWAVIAAVLVAPLAIALAFLFAVPWHQVGLPIAGAGIGLLLNRVVYGLLRPVPAYRLAQARDRAT